MCVRHTRSRNVRKHFCVTETTRRIKGDDKSTTKPNFEEPGYEKGKGKALPLQAWSGPEGSRKLKFPDFMTTAQDCGKVVRLTHLPPLLPGNKSGPHFC